MVIKKITTLLRVETLSFRRSCGIHPAERKTWPQRIAQVEEDGFDGHSRNYPSPSSSSIWARACTRTGRPQMWMKPGAAL